MPDGIVCTLEKRNQPRIEEHIMTRILMIACVLAGPWAALGQVETAAGPEGIQIDFRPVYELGRVCRQRILCKTFGSMKLSDLVPELKFSQTFEQEMTTTCRKINPDKSAVLDLTLGRVVMKQSMAGMEMEFDSQTFDPNEAKDPGKAVVGNIFRAMADCKLTLTLGPDGQPRAVEGFTKVMDKICDELSKDAPSRIAKQVLEVLRKAFDDKAMGESMKQYYRMVPPPGRRRIGDKWEQAWNMTFPGLQAMDHALLLFTVSLPLPGEGTTLVIVTGPLSSWDSTRILRFGQPEEVSTTALKLRRFVVFSGMTYVAELTLWEES